MRASWGYDLLVWWNHPAREGPQKAVDFGENSVREIPAREEEDKGISIEIPLMNGENLKGFSWAEDSDEDW